MYPSKWDVEFWGGWLKIWSDKPCFSVNRCLHCAHSAIYCFWRIRDVHISYFINWFFLIESIQRSKDSKEIRYFRWKFIEDTSKRMTYDNVLTSPETLGCTIQPNSSIILRFGYWATGIFNDSAKQITL